MSESPENTPSSPDPAPPASATREEIERGLGMWPIRRALTLTLTVGIVLIAALTVLVLWQMRAVQYASKQHLRTPTHGSTSATSI